MRRGLALVAVLVWIGSLIWLASDAHAASGCESTVAHPRWCAKVKVVGHRGEEGLNENTLRALRHDHRWGAQFEADQWNLADDTPVVLHDPTLRRTVDPASMPPGVTPSSTPGQLTLDQWRQLRTFGGEPLPTLYQWIRHAQKWHVPGMVEIKYAPVHPDRIARWVRRSSVQISFYHSPHLYFGKCYLTGAQVMRDVGMTVGLKYSGNCPMTLQQMADFGYSYVITAGRLITPTYVRKAHRLGLKVGPFLAGATSWPTLVSARVDYLIVPHVRPAQLWR